MSRPMSAAPPSRGGVDRFQNLLTQLQEEHEKEIRRLKADNERLIDEVRRLGGNPGSQELRQIALPHAEAPKVLLNSVQSTTPTVAEDVGDPSESIFVEVHLHALKGLPHELVAELAASGEDPQCQAVAHVGSEKATSAWLPIQRELWKANPNTVGVGEVTWEGVWEEPPVLNLCVPSSSKSITVELWLPRQKKPIAFTSINVGSDRQALRLNPSGTLEAEASTGDKQPRRQSLLSAEEKIKSITPQPKTLLKLHKMFRVRDEAAKVVMARDLASALKATLHKNKHLNVPLEQPQLEEVMHKLRDVHGEVFGDVVHARKSHAGPSIMPWKGFLNCLLLQKLPDYASGQLALRLFTIQKCLLGDDCPSNMTSQVIMQAYEQVKKPVTSWERFVLIVTAISTLLIACSFIATGVSLDYAPNWAGWFYVDTGFAVLFMFEVFIKMFCLGPRKYFCGPERVWNIFDTILSSGAAGEIVYQVAIRGASTPSRIALTIRVLRLARVSFYMRLINTPLLTELSNIVQGFIIAVPSLFWVMLTLLVIVYVSALGMRAAVETLAEEGTAGPEVCGHPDSLDPFTPTPAGCPTISEMYGKEYCGSVLTCMFTIFRCMIGDCTSTGGRSLPAIWSDGYGWAFYVFYSFCMVCTIFGMFNIITGIFVEATMNGLKDQETHRKYAQAYESNYMTEQLAKLCMCIGDKVRKARQGEGGFAAMLKKSFSSNSFRSDDSPRSDELEQELFLTEEEFIQAIRSSDVRMILDDLDVSVEPRPGVFEAFDTEDDGTVSMSELVAGLMSFRGELQKVDVLTTKKVVGDVRKQLSEMQSAHQMFMTQVPQMMEHIQDRISSASTTLRSNTDPRRLVVAVPRKRLQKW